MPGHSIIFFLERGSNNKNALKEHYQSAGQRCLLLSLILSLAFQENNSPRSLQKRIPVVVAPTSASTLAGQVANSKAFLKSPTQSLTASCSKALELRGEDEEKGSTLRMGIFKKDMLWVYTWWERWWCQLMYMLQKLHVALITVDRRVMVSGTQHGEGAGRQ